MKKIIITTERQVTLDGMMTIGKLENGLRIADFMCCEDVEMETFSGTFKVQGMHDGNVYMQEKPKRIRNRPTFREDNSSLSMGRDGIVYFVFRMPQERLSEIPSLLVKEASMIAAKLISKYFKKGGRVL